MKKAVALFLTLALALFFLAGCAPQAETESSAPDASRSPDAAQSESAGGEVAVDKWIIPVIGVESGSAAGNGKQATFGARYAAQVLNANGGIRGKDVEIVVYDTAMDTAKAITAMAELVDSALVVLGPWDAPSADAVAALAYESGLPFIGASAKSEYAPYNLVYMAESAAVSASALKMWLEQESDIRSICLFYIPTDTNQAASYEACCAAAAEMNVEIAATVELTSGQTDLGPAAVKALASGADGYYCISRVDEYALLVTAMRSRGFNEGRRMCSDFATFSSSLLDLDADLLDGLYISNKIDPGYSDEAWQSFCDAYAAEFSGARPTSASSAGYYDSIMAIASAIEDNQLTGDLGKLQEERTILANALYNLPEIQGCQGSFGWVDGMVHSSAKLFQFNSAGTYDRVK